MHASLPAFRMPDDEQVQHATDAFRMLSDPTRMKIMWALLQGETSVACLAELVGAAPTAVSQHLSKLRLAGIVRGRRQGTYVYYTAADEHVRRLLTEALFHADHDLEGGHGPGDDGATADSAGSPTPGGSLR